MVKMAFVHLLAFLMTCLWRANAQLPSQGPVVTLNAGSVRGQTFPVPFGYLIDRFLGIPYAAPPVGDLRFSAPQPVEQWKGVKDCTTFAAKCPQDTFPFPWNVTVGEMDEDCLYLNVFKPNVVTPDNPVPVLVWIHGGGYYTQTGNNYDGSGFAGVGRIVVVSINYRLGLLGFLNVPGSKLKGNYGMLDQVAALKWVQDNIAKFGGDPTKVTIAGQDAGASSVALHLMSPLSKGLYHQAILQGGGPTSPFATYTSKDPNYGRQYLDKLDCNSNDMLSCLRAKPVQEFLIATDAHPFESLGLDLPLPTIDGHFLLEEPSVLLEKGRFHKVKAIIGVNKDGGSMASSFLQSKAGGQELNHEIFKRAVRESLLVQNGGNDRTRRAVLYKYTYHRDPDSPQRIQENWRRLVGDSWFAAPAIKLAKALAKAGAPPFFYYFTHRAMHSVYPESYGVCHGDEVPYIFGGPWFKIDAMPLATKYIEMERGLGMSFPEAWGNFVTFGDPNKYQKRPDAAAPTITWPPYKTDSEKFLVLDVHMTVGENLLADRLAFWNDLLPILCDHDKQGATAGQPAPTSRRDEL